MADTLPNQALLAVPLSLSLGGEESAVVTSRIEVFDTLCAALLVHLYDSFPNRVHVEFLDLSLEERLEPLEPDEIWQWMETFNETVSWLEEERFIRVETATDDNEFFGVRLTMQGLSVLRAVPSSLEQPKEPLIRRFKDALGESGKIVSKEGLRLAVGSLFTSLHSGSLAGFQ